MPRRHSGAPKDFSRSEHSSSRAKGTQYNLGQDIAPGASGQTFAVTQYKRAIDVPGERARTELARVPKFNYWQGLAAQRQVQGIDKASGIQRRSERCGKPRRDGGGR